MTTNIKTLVVILGPTGSGKTDLSIRVARHFGAPILSVDSRQVYRGRSPIRNNWQPYPTISSPTGR